MRIALEKTARDLSRAFRSLRRSPAFAIAVVLILGLGIGMASAMFAVSSSLLLERWPIADQDRVVTLMGAGKGAASTELPVGIEQVRRYRDQTTALASVAGYAHWGVFAFAIRDGERPLDLRQAAVTGNIFQVLGTRPALGRLLTPDDDRPWGPKTAEFHIVLSWGAWQRVFAGDPGVIRRRLQMPGSNWDPVIVGVAPPGLDFPRGVDYWIPANYEGMDLIGRLAPGATLEAARQDYLDFINTDPAYARLGGQALTATVRPIAQSVMAEARPALIALTVAVGLLLLLACVNVANLILLRAAERIHGVAVRRALGAGSITILRERLAESLVLAAGGGMLGLAVAKSLLLALLRLAPATLPRADTIAQAGTPVTWVAIATLMGVLLFGLGLYGAMARMVAQRTRELGVRMAVGATAGQMRRLVLRNAAIIAGAGAAGGLAVALGGGRLISSLLFEISPADPLTLLGVSTLLLVVALGAAWIPARRATRIDPASALKAD